MVELRTGKHLGLNFQTLFLQKKEKRRRFCDRKHLTNPQLSMVQYCGVLEMCYQGRARGSAGNFAGPGHGRKEQQVASPRGRSERKVQLSYTGDLQTCGGK